MEDFMVYLLLKNQTPAVGDQPAKYSEMGSKARRTSQHFPR